MKVEDGRDDGCGHDANEDGRDDLREAGQDEQDRQDPQSDHECRSNGAIEPEHEGLDFGTEALGVRRESEELGQLAHDDDEGEAVHVADLHLAREQIGDEAKPSESQARSRSRRRSLRASQRERWPGACRHPPAAARGRRRSSVRSTNPGPGPGSGMGQRPHSRRGTRWTCTGRSQAGARPARRRPIPAAPGSPRAQRRRRRRTASTSGRRSERP